MANEQLPASIGDITAGEVLAAEFLLTLAARDGNVLTHPAFFRATGKPGSNVVRVPHVGYGADILATMTPGTATANTGLGDDKTDVTVATRQLVYTNDDLARYMADNKLDPVMFAQFAAVAMAQTVIDVCANLTDGFSATAGSSGIDAAWSDVLAAKALLAVANAQGPMLAMIHPVQWGDLETDALSLGVLPAQTAGGVVNAGLESFKGRWFGVDFYTTSRVPTADAGANRAGGIWTPGGLVWADAELESDGDPNILNLGRGQFERVRSGTASLTSYVLRMVMGAALGIDAAGVTLKTDA